MKNKKTLKRKLRKKSIDILRTSVDTTVGRLLSIILMYTLKISLILIFIKLTVMLLKHNVEW